MSFVFDSSSLIYLGKLKLLKKIKLLRGKKFIPESVYKEVVIKGTERQEPEVTYIQELIEKNVFIVKKCDVPIENIMFLSETDMEVLSLSGETKSIAIIDEMFANELAELYDVKSHGSVYLILKLLEKKVITKKESIQYLDEMILLGFYLSANIYKNVLDVIKKMK